jgi:hypothetical protein
LDHSKQSGFSGANPTIVRFNASVEKIYNLTNSAMRIDIKNKNNFFCIEKTLYVDTLLQRWRFVEKSEFVGLAV